jgi:hypothetical protein
MSSKHHSRPRFIKLDGHVFALSEIAAVLLTPSVTESDTVTISVVTVHGGDQVEQLNAHYAKDAANKMLRAVDNAFRAEGLSSVLIDHSIVIAVDKIVSFLLLGRTTARPKIVFTLATYPQHEVTVATDAALVVFDSLCAELTR